MDIITDSVANWPHKGIATSGTPDEEGVIIPDTVCVFEYVLSGSIIHITAFAPGYYDIGHTENQICIIKPTTYHNDSIVEILEEGGASVTVGDTPPADPADGDLWGDTSDNGLNDIVKSVGSMLMPIGAIYTNKVDATNPGVKFGFGTWVALEGYTVVGRKAGDTDFGTAGATVGAKTVTLTVAQMPAHSHELYAWVGNEMVGATNLDDIVGSGNRNITASQRVGDYMTSVGGGGAHNNIQPSVVAYMWERTA
jgi:hypothetical protein